MKQITMQLGDPLSAKAKEREAHKQFVRQAVEIMKLYPQWGCDDPEVTKDHERLARAILIRKLKAGAKHTDFLRDLREYRLMITEKGWPRKRIMSPLSFFGNDLRRRVSLGYRIETPAEKFSRETGAPPDLAEEFMNLD